tara:strand:- start:812 stop:1102 length:291 start_codon:yes stop_codon:yes gene_type:complete
MIEMENQQTAENNVPYRTNNSNWKTTAIYVGATLVGAVGFDIIGNGFGRDIADLFVESKMGMERAMLGDIIATVSPYVGGALGAFGAYLHQRRQRR